MRGVGSWSCGRPPRMGRNEADAARSACPKGKKCRQKVKRNSKNKAVSSVHWESMILCRYHGNKVMVSAVFMNNSVCLLYCYINSSLCLPTIFGFDVKFNPAFGTFHFYESAEAKRLFPLEPEFISLFCNCFVSCAVIQGINRCHAFRDLDQRYIVWFP